MASAASRPACQSAETEWPRIEKARCRHGELPEGVSTFEGTGDALDRRAGESEQLFSLLEGATCKLPSATALTSDVGASDGAAATPPMGAAKRERTDDGVAHAETAGVRAATAKRAMAELAAQAGAANAARTGRARVAVTGPSDEGKQCSESVGVTLAAVAAASATAAVAAATAAAAAAS